MSTEYRTAYVYVRNTFAGILSETEEGYSFVYDEKYIEMMRSRAEVLC